MPVLRLSLLAAVLALTAAPSSPAATRSVDVRAQQRTEIVGAASVDAAGFAVAPAGDVNGDGIDDVLVGAPQADGRGRRDAGAAYVVFGHRRAAGPARAARVRVGARPSAPGFRILGARSRSFAGLGVAGAGDVNGDGRDDVVVGSDGGAFVVFGRRAGTTVDLAHLGRRGVAVATSRDRRLTPLVAGGLDVNGDGRPDVVVVDRARTSPGSFTGPVAFRDHVAVLFGGMRAGRLDLARLGGRGLVLRGRKVDAVALASDMTGDRRAEVVLQVDEGAESAVRARVAFGRATGGDLLALGERGFAITDQEPYRGTMTIGAGGDVDGDGRGDVVVGSWFRHDATDRLLPGAAFVVRGAGSSEDVPLGSPYPRVTALTGPPLGPGDTIPGGPTAVPRNRVGRSVAIVGDVDRDGHDDVLVGGGGDARGRRGAGRAYLVRGGAHAGALSLGDLGALGVELAGPSASDGFGASVAPAGDVDGDGRADLLVGGAESTRKARERAGVAWVLTRLRP